MASLRVRLEFPDKEKFWLFIDLSQIKTIQDVIDYIDTKHSVSCFKLWLDDAQLYCRETVRILQHGDLIRVSMNPKKRKIETQDNQQNDHNAELVMEEATDSPPPSKPKKKKKSKEDKVVECENLPRLMPVEPLIEAPAVYKRKKKVKQADSEPSPEVAPVVERQKVMKQAVKEYSPEIETEPTIHEATTELDLTNKEPSEEESAKRKRRRRRRKSHQKSPSETWDSSLLQPFESLPDYVPPATKERQHVRFEADSGEDTEVIVGRADAGANGFGIFNQPEFNGTYKTNRANLEKTKTRDSKNNTKPVVCQSPSAASTPVPPQLNALLSLRSAVFSRSSNDQTIPPPSYNNVPPPQVLTSSKVVPSSPKVSASLPAKQEPVKLDPMAFPIIKGLPRVNDLIAFKVLELSENYNPEVSDYMQGRITYMSPGSDITVELLDPKPKLHSRGKFEIVEQDEEEYDEEPEVEYETTVTYHWSQMIEPRLIFP